MFEYSQDIALLHGAVISSQNAVASHETDTVPVPSLCDLTKHQQENVIEIISNAVHFTLNNYHLMKDVKSHISIQRRMHAVLLYTALKSSSVVCKSAEEYYESVSDIFPQIDWQLYSGLCEKCCWGELMTESMVQLPDVVAAHILNEIMSKTENILHVTHSVLQSSLYKLFRINEVQSKTEDVMPFNFNFSFDKANTSKYECAETDDNILCNEYIANELSFNYVENSDFYQFFNSLLCRIVNFKSIIDTTKILLHGFITMFKIASVNKSYLDILLSEKAFEKYSFAASKYFSYLMVKSELKFTFENFNVKQFITPNESKISWNSDIGYLMFIAYNNWKKLSQQLQSNLSIEAHKSELYITTENVFKELFALYPLNTCDNFDMAKNYIQMQIFLIDNKHEGMSYAVEYFLENPMLLMQNEILTCLERNSTALNDISFPTLLLQVITKYNFDEKNRLVQLLMSICENVPSVYAQLLKKHISEYGEQAKMKLPSFDQELSTFLSRAVNFEQAQVSILKLCLQSPREIVERIVNRAIECRYLHLIKVLIQCLKQVSCVCCYQKNEDDIQLLIQVLKSYYELERITETTADNIFTFSNELFQVFSTVEEFSYCQFLECCILQNLNGSASELALSLYMKVLNVVLEQALKFERKELLAHVNTAAFILTLCKLMNFCVNVFNPELKELIIAVLDTLLQLKIMMKSDHGFKNNDEIWLKNSLLMIDPLVPFYIQKHLGFIQINCDVPSLSLTLLLGWCCVTNQKSPLMFKECIKRNPKNLQYANLILALIQLLPHFTSDECLRLSLLLQEYTELSSSNGKTEEYLKKIMPLSNIKYPSIIVIQLYTDSLLLLKKCTNISLNWPYMIGCLLKVIKAIMDNLEKEFRFSTFLIMFCEMCRLTEAFDNDGNIFCVALHELLTEIKKDFNQSVNYEDICKLLTAVINDIPDCDVKTHVLKGLK